MGAPHPDALEFVKMHGAGNDYVYVDGIAAAWLDEQALADRVVDLSDRHRGIGGDGVILLARANATSAASVRMVMWNADGSRGAFCGNGLRCLARLARTLGHVDTDRFPIETDAGTVGAELLRSAPGGEITAVRVDLPAARAAAEREPIEWRENQTITVRRADVGNPHAVWWVDAVDAAPLEAVGSALQEHPAFPDGVNLEAAERLGPDHLRQRTWERGSGETLACGSGAVATALVAVAEGVVEGPRVRIDLPGGSLHVEVGGSGAVLEGPVAEVYKGRFPWGPDCTLA